MRLQDYGILLAMIFGWPPFLGGVGSFVGVGDRCVGELLLHGRVLILSVGLKQVLKLIALGEELIGGLSEIVYPL